ncbi:ornithine cyclodeaminase family protein [Nocardioides sp.]|uniref:ornithine cyclodeaminase family protein n=1 Tax=Nocardioides sp. TaxID=35761 RepID=UPI0035298BE8
MSEPQLLVLNRADLERLELTWDEIIDVLDDAFLQKSRGLVQNPPKPKVVPREDAFVNAMPAYLGGSDGLGIKWVSGHEQNSAKGLPYIFGSLLMNDADTGRPLALVDGGWVTEMRTPGASGVTMRHVPGSPTRVGIVGCGVQGRRHLEVTLAVHPGIEEVVAFDHRMENVQEVFDLADGRRTTFVSSPEETLEGVDIAITCITRALEPKLDAANTSADALLLPVDYDDAMAAPAFSGASIYVVDDHDQYAAVAARGHYFQGLPEPTAELADVVSGGVSVPEHGRRMFLNMGIAMDDIALGQLVLARAEERGVGQRVAFP